MKKKDVPQDKSGLTGFTKEVYYAQNEEGEYTTELSEGWNVKSEALDVAWNSIKHRVEDARKKVEAGEASPILFFMELKLMDVSILSAYTGFWKFNVQRHLRAKPFSRLSAKKLQKYAEVFDISVDDLKQMRVHED